MIPHAHHLLAIGPRSANMIGGWIQLGMTKKR